MVPSIVLKHAPDTCKIYVVSANKIISNFLNPISTSGMFTIKCLSYLISFATLTCMIGTLTGTERDSCSFTFSSSSSESKYKNCLSDVSHLPSHSQTTTFSSVNPDATKETSHQASEERLSDMSRNKGFPSISSADSKQVHSSIAIRIIFQSRKCVKFLNIYFLSSITPSVQ